MRKYLYKNLEVVPYWNNYNVYYRHEDGTRETLTLGHRTKADAYKAGKMQVDYLNEKASIETKANPTFNDIVKYYTDEVNTLIKYFGDDPEDYDNDITRACELVVDGIKRLKTPEDIAPENIDIYEETEAELIQIIVYDELQKKVFKGVRA